MIKIQPLKDTLQFKKKISKQAKVSKETKPSYFIADLNIYIYILKNKISLRGRKVA